MNIIPPSIKEYEAVVSKLETLAPTTMEGALCPSAEALKEIYELKLAAGDYERWNSIQNKTPTLPSDSPILDNNGEAVPSVEPQAQ